MSNLNATQGRLSGGNRDAAFRTSLLFRLTPILLVAALAGCASTGKSASASGHGSGGERGYGAQAGQADDSNGLSADSSAASSMQAGATGRGKTGHAGVGGAGDTPDAMNQSDTAAGPADSAMADGDGAGVDPESSLTDSGAGGGRLGGRGAGRRGARSARHGTAASGGAGGDDADGVDSATDGTGAGAARGARGTAAGRGGGSVEGSDDSVGDGASDGSRTLIAAVEVPSNKVEIDEEYQRVTLGGALPLIVGVNEEGRFDFDQYALRDEVKAILDALTETLKTAEYDRLDIVGYTDRIGSVEHNQRLSELRAYAVAQYLVRKGVPENKIRYEGRGARDPLTRDDECRELVRDDLIACLQKDRRVEIEASIHRKHATVQ